MAFPHHDRPWAETAAFLQGRLGPADRLVAPAPFRFVFPGALRYAALRGAPPRDFAWSVIHKGELARIPRGFLGGLAGETVPVFANEVFVVFATAPPTDLPDLGESDHVRAFRVALEALPPEPPPGVAGPGGGVTAVQLPQAEAAAPLQRARAAPRPPREPGAPPPRPWGAAGGATRERALQEEMDRLVADALGPGTGLRVLDIGCGDGRLAPLLPAAAAVVGVDLAADALARARARHAGLPGFAFARMDAARLAFADGRFDAVLLLDVLDLLDDPAAALAETARVLAPGGRLLVTALNRESLPLRAARRLALPLPPAGVSVQGLAGMLRAAGLEPERVDGLLLPLGWGLPAAGGFDALEEEAEFVEASRLLGRRCGPEMAAVIGMLARKA